MSVDSAMFLKAAERAIKDQTGHLLRGTPANERVQDLRAELVQAAA